MRSPPKTAKPRRVLDHSRPDSQWSPQEPGRRKRSGRACARIGVGYGALGQANCLPQWVVSYPNSSLRSRAASARPTPMVGFLPQCVSLESGGGAGPVLTAIPRGLRAPGPGSRAPWAVFTAIPTRRGTLSQRYLRFHSATTLCKRYNALGFSQEVQRAVCVGFLRGFPAEAFAWSLVELIVHLLDPRGAGAVQWGPLGEGRWCSHWCRAARGSGPGRSGRGRPVILEGRDRGRTRGPGPR